MDQTTENNQQEPRTTVEIKTSIVERLEAFANDSSRNRDNRTPTETLEIWLEGCLDASEGKDTGRYRTSK